MGEDLEVAAAAATAHQDLATSHLPVATRNPTVVISHLTPLKHTEHTKTQHPTLIPISMQELEKHTHDCMFTTSQRIITVKQAITQPHFL